MKRDVLDCKKQAMEMISSENPGHEMRMVVREGIMKWWNNYYFILPQNKNNENNKKKRKIIESLN